MGYKAEAGIDEEKLVERAEKRMKDTGCDLMVTNLLEDVGVDETRAFILDKEGDVGEVTGSREKVVESLLEAITNIMEEE